MTRDRRACERGRGLGSSSYALYLPPGSVCLAKGGPQRKRCEHLVSKHRNCDTDERIGSLRRAATPPAPAPTPAAATAAAPAAPRQQRMRRRSRRRLRVRRIAGASLGQSTVYRASLHTCRASRTHTQSTARAHARTRTHTHAHAYGARSARGRARAGGWEWVGVGVGGVGGRGWVWAGGRAVMVSGGSAGSFT